MGIGGRFFHKTLFIDTAPLIYYIEGRSKYQDKLQEIFDANDQGEIYFQTSTLTLLEVLVQPIRLKKTRLADRYEEILTTSPNIDILDLSIAISKCAAKLRADYNIKTPDSIQIATGVEQKADFFLTNDKKLKHITEIEILLIDEI